MTLRSVFPAPIGTTDLSSVRSERTERTGRMAESHCKGRYVYPWSTLAFIDFNVLFKKKYLLNMTCEVQYYIFLHGTIKLI